MKEPASRLAAMRWWHIPAVERLERELFGAEAWSPEMFWSELAQPQSRYYLIATSVIAAAAEPDVIGYGGLAMQGPDAYIQTVGVAHAAQRKGIGRRLMSALLDEAMRRGATQCWLEVRTDNFEAQQLYRTLGFTEQGVRRGYYQPSGGDALIMSARLPVTPAAAVP